MKLIKWAIFLLLFLTAPIVMTGCGSPNTNGGAVVLDGPILETVAKTGDFEFNGAVINISNEPVSSVFVVILLKDENGETIEANSVSLLSESEDIMLMPGESAFFTVNFKTDPSSALNKDVEIYYDESNFIE